MLRGAQSDSLPGSSSLKAPNFGTLKDDRPPLNKPSSSGPKLAETYVREGSRL